MECAVAAGGAEGAVDGVEGYGVYGVYIADVARIGWAGTMTLEGEVGGTIFLLDILYRATPFDTADREAGCVGEAAYNPRLPF